MRALDLNDGRSDVDIFADDDTLNPENRLIDEEFRRLIRECVSQLRPAWQVFLTYWLEGFSKVEIASVLNVPEGTIYPWFKRLKKPLRDCLESKGIEPNWTD